MESCVLIARNDIIYCDVGVPEFFFYDMERTSLYSASKRRYAIRITAVNSGLAIVCKIRPEMNRKNGAHFSLDFSKFRLLIDFTGTGAISGTPEVYRSAKNNTRA